MGITRLLPLTRRPGSSRVILMPILRMGTMATDIQQGVARDITTTITSIIIVNAIISIMNIRQTRTHGCDGSIVACPALA